MPAALRPLATLDHPIEAVRRFTPNWFAATMGTGIVALLPGQFPESGPLLHSAGETLWRLNSLLFLLCATMYAVRWLLFPQEARRILDHGVASMSLGTIPMGLATIINGLLLYHGATPGAVAAAETLWWIDILLALACGVGIPLLMFTRQHHAIENMTALWLLPIVAAEVAAVSGALLAPHLLTPEAQRAALFASYALWACSVPVAFAILTILILRMALHKLPPAEMAATSWLGLGPIATGALGLLLLGNAAPAILSEPRFADIATVAHGLGLIGATLLWGFGLWWLLLASAITLGHARTGAPFNLGWWAYVFPLGVYTLVTLRLAAQFDLAPLMIFGRLLTAALLLAWLIVATRTLRGAWRGDLFDAPCLRG